MTLPRKTSYQQHIEQMEADLPLLRADLDAAVFWRNIMMCLAVAGCVGCVAFMILTQIRTDRAVHAIGVAYDRGLDQGTALKNDALQKAFMAGYKASEAHMPATPAGRGPLDLTKLSPDQARRARCYLQDGPGVGIP